MHTIPDSIEPSQTTPRKRHRKSSAAHEHEYREPTHFVRPPQEYVTLSPEQLAEIDAAGERVLADLMMRAELNGGERYFGDDEGSPRWEWHRRRELAVQFDGEVGQQRVIPRAVLRAARALGHHDPDVWQSMAAYLLGKLPRVDAVRIVGTAILTPVRRSERDLENPRCRLVLAAALTHDMLSEQSSATEATTRGISRGAACDLLTMQRLDGKGRIIKRKPSVSAVFGSRGAMAELRKAGRIRRDQPVSQQVPPGERGQPRRDDRTGEITSWAVGRTHMPSSIEPDEPIVRYWGVDPPLPADLDAIDIELSADPAVAEKQLGWIEEDARLCRAANLSDDPVVAEMERRWLTEPDAVIEVPMPAPRRRKISELRAANGAYLAYEFDAVEVRSCVVERLEPAQVPRARRRKLARSLRGCLGAAVPVAQALHEDARRAQIIGAPGIRIAVIDDPEAMLTPEVMRRVAAGEPLEPEPEVAALPEPAPVERRRPTSIERAVARARAARTIARARGRDPPRH